tara:strand:- start:44 stop:844 length:801 start_codon:yes stop_codon:yes gene_type:complete
MNYLNYGNQVQDKPQEFDQQKVELTLDDFSFGDLGQQTTQPKVAPQTNKINDELIQLFATPLLVCKCTIDYSREEKWCRDYECTRKNGEVDLIKKKINSHYNRQSKDTFILDNPELKNIRSFIEEKLNLYSNKILGSSNKLVITQSWLNKSVKGEHHHIHHHPNSIISGVWYPAINDQLPPIQFQKNGTRDFNLSIVEGGYNHFNSHNFSLALNKGELILFPSNLQHSVPYNQSDEERISLSFNTWSKGSLGNIDSLTYLPLERCV